MVNPFKDTNWNPDLAERRSFARSLMIGFPILALVWAIIVWLTYLTPKDVEVIGDTGQELYLTLFLLGSGGFAVGLILWLLPQIARPFYLVWYFAACCVGIVISNLLLSAFFFLVITPFGLLMRAFGRDPMHRRSDPAAKSYWRAAEKITDAKRYYRQF